MGYGVWAMSYELWDMSCAILLGNFLLMAVEQGASHISPGASLARFGTLAHPGATHTPKQQLCYPRFGDIGLAFASESCRRRFVGLEANPREVAK